MEYLFLTNDIFGNIYAKGKATGDMSESCIGAMNKIDVEIANK